MNNDINNRTTQERITTIKTQYQHNLTKTLNVIYLIYQYHKTLSMNKNNYFKNNNNKLSNNNINKLSLSK